MNDAIKTAAAAALPTITLKAGEQRRMLLGHPWVYSNEIAMDAAAKALPRARQWKTVATTGARWARRCSIRAR
jgi:23S rRNA (cytosine1962-C5)-methyltransferase